MDNDWACVSFGILLCLECAGRHRGLGVNISFVRSIHLDNWTNKEVTDIVVSQYIDKNMRALTIYCILD